MRKKILRNVIFYIGLILLLMVVVFPFYWMISCSFKTNNEIFSNNPQLIPREPTFESYHTVFNVLNIDGYSFLYWIGNSVFICGIATVLSVAISSLGGYALSRFHLKGSGIISYTVLITQMLPGVLLLVPLYIIFSVYGLLDSLYGLIIAYTTFSVPFSMWMIRGFFNSIPREIDEAAIVDGCNRLQAFIKVILPIATPGIAATALFAFIVGWNDYLFASVFIKSTNNWTVTVGLTFFRGQYIIAWNNLMTASLIITLPIVVLFLYLQNYLVKGLTAGSVKG